MIVTWKGDNDTRYVRTSLSVPSGLSIVDLQNQIQTSARYNARRSLGKVSCDSVVPALRFTHVIEGGIGNNGKAISIRVLFTQHADTCFIGKWLVDSGYPKLIYLGLEIDTVRC